MNTKLLLTILIYGFLIGVLAQGCDRPAAQRQYKEIFIEAEQKRTTPTDHAGMLSRMMPQDEIHSNLNLERMMDGPSGEGTGGMSGMAVTEGLRKSVDRTPLRWETPAGWTEETGNGMRVVTFRNSDPEYPVEVSVIALGGNAGGLAANIARWMRQVGIPVPDTAALNAFIRDQEKLTTVSGLPVTLIDLTGLQEGAPGRTSSMITAVIDRESSQVFIKMTGSKMAVLKNRAPLKKLTTSITVNE